LGLADTPVRDDEVGISLLHGYFGPFWGPSHACCDMRRQQPIARATAGSGAISSAASGGGCMTRCARRAPVAERGRSGSHARYGCGGGGSLKSGVVASGVASASTRGVCTWRHAPPWRGGGESMAGQWRCVRGGQMRCATSLSLAAQMLTECARSQRGGFCVPCVSGSRTGNSTGVTAA
jgi:hypothetical protein